MLFCFGKSKIASGIELGNSNYLSGKSSTEMLIELLEKDICYNQIPLDRTPEYWAGWILTYAQWNLDKPFADILAVMSFSKLINFYHPYHETPEMKMVKKIQDLFSKEPMIRKYRLLRNLSQAQLSILSGVKLCSIQCYEQGDIDIRNAQVKTIYALAKALDCTIEELIK